MSHLWCFETCKRCRTWFERTRGQRKGEEGSADAGNWAAGSRAACGTGTGTFTWGKALVSGSSGD